MSIDIKYPEFMIRCIELGRDISNEIYKINVPKNFFLPARLILGRAINNIHCIDILCESGYGMQASYVARVTYEDLVNIAHIYLCREKAPQYQVERFLAYDLTAPARALKKLNGSDYSAEKVARARTLEKQFLLAYGSLAGLSGKDLKNKTKQVLSDWSGLRLNEKVSCLSDCDVKNVLDTHHKIYQSLCESLHGSIEAYRELVESNAKGDFDILLGPSRAPEDIIRPLAASSMYFLFTQKVVLDILDTEERVGVLRARLEKLQVEWAEKFRLKPPV